MFLSVTALKVPGETTKGLHLALFLFSTPRKNIGKSLKKEKNSAFSKVLEGTEKKFLVGSNVLSNLPFEFFRPAINLPSVKIFRFQICICSVSIFQPSFRFEKVGC